MFLDKFFVANSMTSTIFAKNQKLNWAKNMQKSPKFKNNYRLAQNLRWRYRMAQNKVAMPLKIAYHRCGLGPTRELYLQLSYSVHTSAFNIICIYGKSSLVGPRPHVWYAISSGMTTLFWARGGTLMCPNGHGLSWLLLGHLLFIKEGWWEHLCSLDQICSCWLDQICSSVSVGPAHRVLFPFGGGPASEP